MARVHANTEGEQGMRTRRVLITPTPGFVIKTTTVKPGFYTPVPALSSTSSSGSASNISPPAVPTIGGVTRTHIPLPSSLKTFINVTFSPSVPAPPTPLSPEEEERLLRGILEGIREGEGYYIPVIVNEGQEGRDKAGKPSIVFDAILNPALKGQMMKSINFKSFVLEIILSQIESPDSQASDAPIRSLTLSRTLATPNIRYKGTLEARVIEVPEFWGVAEGENLIAKSSPGGPSATNLTANLTSNTPKRPLIEEISSESPKSPLTTEQKPKSILKKPGAAKGGGASFEIEPESVVQPKTYEEERGVQQENERLNSHTEMIAPDADLHVMTLEDAGKEVPEWKWEGDAQTRTLVIEVPKLTRSDHEHSTLSLSADIMTLRTPGYFLQVVLDESKAGAERRKDQSRKVECEVNGNREVDLEKARAEWRVVDGRMVVYL